MIARGIGIFQFSRIEYILINIAQSRKFLPKIEKKRSKRRTGTDHQGKEE